MQNILIVDDEMIFRDFLRSSISWEAYGFHIAAEARNGREALQIMMQTHVDIALVDINMPHMDGLQLSEQVRNQWPHVKIVLVTGHNEFEYARRGIKLGVSDYILKPFSKEELILTLLKLKEHIDSDRKDQETYQSQMELWKEAYFNRLFLNDGIDSEHVIQQQAKIYGIKEYLSVHQMACIEIDRLHNSRWEKASERRLWKFAITNILTEILDEQFHIQLFQGPEGRMVCMISYMDSDDEANIIRSLESLCSLIKTYLKFTVSIGIGNQVDQLSKLHISYREAIRALQQKFIVGSDRVISYRQVSQEAKSTPAIPGELQEKLVISLRMNDEKEVRSVLDRIFHSLSEGKSSIEHIYVSCMGLISLCLSHISDSGHPIEDCFGEQFFPYSEILKKETAEDVYAWLRECFTQGMRYGQVHKLTRSGKIALQAKQYLEENYSQSDLSLEDVAGQVFVNSGYLRAIFKKEFGMTISEYVTYYRMQMAKDYISSGKYKLSDIAERVGYNDSGYFSKSFKKFYGYNPSEYETLKKN